MKKLLHGLFGHHYARTWFGFECDCGQRSELVDAGKGPRFRPPFTRRDTFERYAA